MQIERATARVMKLVESTLQLSNIDLISTYAFKGERSSSVPATLTVQNEIISPALSDAQVFFPFPIDLINSVSRNIKQ